jgi:phosphate transport system substrate-binding protein
MSYGLRKLSTRTKLVTAALALAMAGVSHAQTSTTLVGGGATLPSIGYVGSAAANASTPQVFGSNVASGSLFGQSGVAISYCLTGSGAGKNILAGITNENVQNACPTSTGTGGVTLGGFGAPAVMRTDLTQPNFAGADAPLATSDFANYLGGHSNDNPVEFPAVAGAVAIAFNLVDNTGATVTSSEVNFSDAQLCSIFSGAVNTWNASSLASAFTLPAGHSIPNMPINVQYRSDGSGTSFSFSNHLTTACNVTSSPLETSQSFFPAPGTTGTPATYIVQNFFTYVNDPTDNDGLPNGNGSTTGAKWTGSSGNPAVANAIASTSNSIGYVETANALATNPGLQFADVDSKSPVSNFGSALSLVSLSVSDNEAINAVNGTNGTPNNANGTPQIVALTNSVNPLPTGSHACIVLVKPTAYAVPGSSVVGDINPTGNYPIVAVSYLLGNSVGNGTDLTNTQTLVTSPYNTTIRPNVTTIGGTTGLQFLNPGTVFTTSQVSGCYGS